MSEATRLKALRLLADNPRLTQRDLARELGVSLGSANYCLRALIDKGLVKAERFRHSHRKRAYLYLLTPAPGRPSGCAPHAPFSPASGSSTRLSGGRSRNSNGK